MGVEWGEKGFGVKGEGKRRKKNPQLFNILLSELFNIHMIDKNNI